MNRHAGRPEDPALTFALKDAAVGMLTEGVPVTVEGLRRRTGVSRPSFYRRYPSTDALVSHIRAWATMRAGPDVAIR